MWPKRIETRGKSHDGRDNKGNQAGDNVHVTMEMELTLDNNRNLMLFSILASHKISSC